MLCLYTDSSCCDPLGRVWAATVIDISVDCYILRTVAIIKRASKLQGVLGESKAQGFSQETEGSPLYSMT